MDTTSPNTAPVQPTSFVLRPCKIRGTSIVPIKDGELTNHTWRTLLTAFGEPTRSLAANLQRLRTGYYVGMCKKPGVAKPVSFIVVDPGQTGDLKATLQKNADFVAQVQEIYRVEAATWGGSCTEFK